MSQGKWHETKVLPFAWGWLSSEPFCVRNCLNSLMKEICAFCKKAILKDCKALPDWWYAGKFWCPILTKALPLHCLWRSRSTDGLLHTMCGLCEHFAKLPHHVQKHFIQRTIIWQSLQHEVIYLLEQHKLLLLLASFISSAPMLYAVQGNLFWVIEATLSQSPDKTYPFLLNSLVLQQWM